MYNVNEWCTERADRYWRERERERRIREQFAERNMLAQPKTARGLAMARAWTDRSDPAAQKLSGRMSKSDREKELAEQAKAKLIAEFGKAALDDIPSQPLPKPFSHLPDPWRVTS